MSELYHRSESDGRDALVRANFKAWHDAIAPCRALSLLQAEEEGARSAPLPADAEGDAQIVAEALTLPADLPADDLTLRALTMEERLAFCRALPPLPEGAAVTLPTEPAPTAVLSNPFFAAATERFSDAVCELAPLPVSTFAEICEEVGSGRAAFGILPLEDSDDGKLYRFYEQADSFELHVRCTCDVPYRDGSRTMRLALLSLADAPTPVIQGERMLECSLLEDRDCTEAELLAAAAACGLSLRRVDSLPAPYTEDGFYLRSVFRATEEGEALFERFIRCFMPRAVITARYVHLK